MCGIAGFLHLDGRPADRAALSAMCAAIVHRGPDGEGLLAEGPVALGMRRLAIIDVSGGDQPIHTPDGRYSIVFNGEVYNFAAERAALERKGHRFHTRSDTEVVLHLFAEYGTACVDRLRGMFAFAIWDRHAQSLFLARDRIGKKPLHFWTDGKTLLFGSEIKALLSGLAALGIPKPALRLDALVDYVGLSYIPDPHTIYEHIEKLPPAHWMTVEQGQCTTRQYWEPSFDPKPGVTEADAMERLEASLEEAVRIRLMSEVPLGAYLSGGVDSSTVVALMRRVSTGPVNVFCVGFEEQEFDERPFARRIAEHLDVSFEEFTVRADSEEVAEAVARQFDEPFGDSSAIPTYYVSKMARQRVTVILSGDGGDELFAGYPRYLKASGGGPLARLPLVVRRALFGTLGRMLPAGVRGRARLLDLALDDDGRYVFNATRGISEDGPELFTSSFQRAVGIPDPGRRIRSRLRTAARFDPITRRMQADIFDYLPGDIMTKVDRMSMMVSLEARAPLLDHHVVELAASLPLDLKLRGTTQKYLLRKLSHKLLSPELIERPKQGFAVPVRRWINGPWKSRTDEMIESLLRRDILSPRFIRRLVAEHRAERRDHGEFLWSLLALEIWFRAAGSP